MGRKKKQGPRTKSGRLSRAISAIRDAGTDRTALKFSIYGTDGADPIGRAYVMGFLGHGQDAKALLDTSRAIFRAYWAWYENGPINCTLADRKSGAWVDNDSDREARQEEWLNRMLKKAGPQGRDKRRWFDELVINIQPDEGPDWLDRLINFNRWEAESNRVKPSDWLSWHQANPEPPYPLVSDHVKLASVIETLEQCAEVQKYSVAA